MLFKLITVALFTLACFSDVANGYRIPCTKQGTPSGCLNRVTGCTACASGQDGTQSKPWCVQAGTNYECSEHINPTNRRPGQIPTSGTPLNQNKIAKWYQVQWTNSANRCEQMVMQMGESWGKNPINGGDYGCQGRCGGGCPGWTSWCSNYGQDCLKHDVCSWYHGSSGGASDSNCGGEFNQASNDWATDCMFNNYCEVNDPSARSGGFA